MRQSFSYKVIYDIILYHIVNTGYHKKACMPYAIHALKILLKSNLLQVDYSSSFSFRLSSTTFFVRSDNDLSILLPISESTGSSSDSNSLIIASIDLV